MPLTTVLAIVATAVAPSAVPAALEPELAGAAAGAVRTPSAPDAWGGPRTGREPTLSNRVADYAIQAVLDPVRHTIEGTERITWRNRSAVAVPSLYLHLYLNAFESEGSTFHLERARHGGSRSDVPTRQGEWGYTELRGATQGGRPATWAFVHPDGGPETDHTVVRLDLPEPVAPGGVTTVELSFHDQLPRVVARAGWFGTFHLAGQWYPKVGVLELAGERGATRPRWNCHEYHLHSEFYADFGAYHLEVTAPAGTTVAASGARIGEPSPVPGGVLHRFRAEDVHDVAFAAWDGFAPPLRATWTGPGSPPVAVQVLHPPEFEASARETLQATLDALDVFSRTLFPYPHATVTVVVPPYNAGEAGGMEYETFFTSVGSNVLPWGAPGVARGVAVHELGHGYFMGLIASNEFEEPFLDEGLDEWWDLRMLAGEAIHFPAPAPLRWIGLEGISLPFEALERALGSVRHAADPIAGNSWHRWSGASYGLVYGRTVAVFHDLAALVGEATAARAMRLYAERWRFRHPGAGDLEQAWVDAGADPALVRRWFDEQVFGAAPVDDRVVSVTSEPVRAPLGLAVEDGARRELTEAARDVAERDARRAWGLAHGEPAAGRPGPAPWRTVVSARRFAAQAPRTLVLTFEDGSVERLPWPAGERWHRWELVRPVAVRQAELTPALMLDLDRFDDGRTREARRWPAARLAAEAEGWLRLLYAAVGAL
jgi:hypothetical protein